MERNNVFIWSLVIALGGFLFGFDTAVISGAEQSIQTYWSLSSLQHGLTVSRFGHSVVWQTEWYQVFRFGREEDAETFKREFGRERMHPSERGRGINWARWRKGSYKPKGTAR